MYGCLDVIPVNPQTTLSTILDRIKDKTKWQTWVKSLDSNIARENLQRNAAVRAQLDMLMAMDGFLNVWVILDSQEPVDEKQLYDQFIPATFRENDCRNFLELAQNHPEGKYEFIRTMMLDYRKIKSLHILKDYAAIVTRIPKLLWRETVEDYKQHSATSRAKWSKWLKLL